MTFLLSVSLFLSSPDRFQKQFLDYGGTVVYGLESTPSAWLRRHAIWGRYLFPPSRQGLVFKPSTCSRKAGWSLSCVGR